MAAFMHAPVLLKEVIEWLDFHEGETVVDGTINGGGHAMAILEHIGSRGRLLGIDRDFGLIEKLQQRIQKEHIKNFEVVQGSFKDIINITTQYKVTSIQKIILDLGFSSYHVDESKRGFSFNKDEPLDMRYDTGGEDNAHDLLMTLAEEDLTRTFKEYGEERFARSIARHIVAQRNYTPIQTTGQLVEVIARSVPGWYRRSRVHFATRIFQALRIAVNHELEHVQEGVRAAVTLLAPKGRIAVISFHSLEDRIIKQTFNDLKKTGVVAVCTKKPIIPTREEVKVNPRARSAKLRVAEKI